MPRVPFRRRVAPFHFHRHPVVVAHDDPIHSGPSGSRQNWASAERISPGWREAFQSDELLEQLVEHAGGQAPPFVGRRRRMPRSKNT